MPDYLICFNTAYHFLHFKWAIRMNTTMYTILTLPRPFCHRGQMWKDGRYTIVLLMSHSLFAVL